MHGRHLYGEHWNCNALYFLNSKKPNLVGFEIPIDELETLVSQGEHLNEMAVENAKAVTKHLIKHLDRFFLSDNYRTLYAYDGEVIDYDFINSECIDAKSKSHLCWITLKPSSEFIDQKSIQLFDPNVSKTMQKNNKGVLVSKAVLVYFDFFGIPANRKVLVSKVIDEYQSVYGESVNENLVYDAIAVMSDFWLKRSSN